MAIDTSAVLTAITEGQTATVAVALAVAVAWWAIRSIKLLRYGFDEVPEGYEDDSGSDDAFLDADAVSCSECDEPMAFESWLESTGICIHCGARGGDWFMEERECEVCGIELPALVDDQYGDYSRVGDHGEMLCPACAGDERV